MTALHLIDDHPQPCSPATLALVTQTIASMPAVAHRVMLMGNRSLQARAQAAGLHQAELVTAPRAVTCPLIRLSLARRLPKADDIQLVHCWSLDAFALARSIYRNTPRLLTITDPPDPQLMRGLARRMRPALERIITCSETARHTLHAAGIPPQCILVIRPTVSRAMLACDARPSIRRAWGIDDDRTPIVALLSDPPAHTDAIAGMMAVGLANESLPKPDKPATPARAGNPPALLRLLVHPAQYRRYRAERMLREAGATYELIQDAQLDAPWRILPACDAALALSPHVGLSLHWAIAGDLPIIADDTPAHREILAGYGRAILCPSSERRDLAHRLRQLFASPLAPAAAASPAAPESFATLHAVYQQLAPFAPAATV